MRGNDIHFKFKIKYGQPKDNLKLSTEYLQIYYMRVRTVYDGIQPYIFKGIRFIFSAIVIRNFFGCGVFTLIQQYTFIKPLKLKRKFMGHVTDTYMTKFSTEDLFSKNFLT